MTLHVVGLDWSMTKTGVAVIRPETLDEPILRLVKSDALGLPKGADFYVPTLNRMRGIISRARKIALTGFDEENDILVIVAEGASLGSFGGQAHQDTRAGLRWLGAQTFEVIGRPKADGRPGAYATVPPTSLKSYVAKNGSASKALMIERAHERAFPNVNFRPHPNEPRDDNLVDAFGLAAMACRVLGHPVEPSPQRVNPSALNGVVWPSWMDTYQNRKDS